MEGTVASRVGVVMTPWWGRNACLGEMVPLLPVGLALLVGATLVLMIVVT